AVGGGADLVRNVGTAFGREGSGKSGVDSRDLTGCVLQALAGVLAVHGGLGQGDQGLDSIAAGGCWGSASLEVPQAWRQRALDLTTGQGFGHWHN
ncbi:hypothetical protein PanWU01x14_215420, partial [Parasponia andersonii]